MKVASFSPPGEDYTDAWTQFLNSAETCLSQEFDLAVVSLRALAMLSALPLLWLCCTVLCSVAPVLHILVYTIKERVPPPTQISDVICAVVCFLSPFLSLCCRDYRWM